MGKQKRIKPRKLKGFPKSKKPPSDYLDPVDHPTGSLEKAAEIAKQKTEGKTMFTKIPRFFRKVVSAIAAVAGVSFGGFLSAGEVVTGDTIIDAVIILGAIVVLLLNGKEGVPDWLVHAVKGRTVEEEENK